MPVRETTEIAYEPAAHAAQASPEDELSDHEEERKAGPMREAGPLERRLLNISEVAAYTGLATKTLYTMVSQRRIPFVKLGRLTKFDREELDRWINRHSVKPNRTLDSLT